MERMQRLARTVEKPKAMTVQPIDMNMAVEFKAGPGGASVWKTLVDITEETRQYDELHMMMRGGCLVVPVVELRTMKLPVPDRREQIKFQEGRKNTIDSEGMWRTIDDMANDLNKHHQDMVNSGIPNADKKIETTDEYIKLHSYLDQEAEVMTKERVKEVLEALGVPALLVRGLKLEKKTIENLQKFGLLTRLPRNDKGHEVWDWEADIIAAYTEGATLHVIVGEVKRKNRNPWESSKALDHGVVSKALNQLRMDLEFMQVTNRKTKFVETNLLSPGHPRGLPCHQPQAALCGRVPGRQRGRAEEALLHLLPQPRHRAGGPGRP